MGSIYIYIYLVHGLGLWDSKETTPRKNVGQNKQTDLLFQS